LTCNWLLAACLHAGTVPIAENPGIEPLDSLHDGVYGRFESDLDAGVAAGAALVSADPSFALRGTLHYFSTAGVYLGAELPSKGPTPTTLAFGVDLRPAFLPRFSENLEQGPAWLDLAIDSISLSLGPYFEWSDAGNGRGLDASLGVGLPLFARASGLWLEARGVGRFPDEARDARFGALVLVGWHVGFSSPWVDRTP
jgi:hypothetical protein